MVLDLSHYLTSNIKEGMRGETPPHLMKGYKKEHQIMCRTKKFEGITSSEKDVRTGGKGYKPKAHIPPPLHILYHDFTPISTEKLCGINTVLTLFHASSPHSG